MTPFLLVNAGSGGGKTQDSILAVATELDVPHHVVQPGDDFSSILNAAVDGGADVLAAAGGDGTLCTTADVAMEHSLPMIVVPAGTRNHFALDLGLDLDNPADVLRSSLTSGYERRVDVGTINGSSFLNNVSLGIYAAAVGSEGYREHKVRALVNAAAEAAGVDEERTARLSIELPDTSIDRLVEGSGAIMIVNNAYAPTFAPGSRLRPRLDAGEVWVYIGGGVAHTRSKISAVAHAISAAVSQELLNVSYGAQRFVITSDRPDIPVAVDGEVRPDLTAPLEFASRPRALRLLVPSDPTPHSVEVLLTW